MVSVKLPAPVDVIDTVEEVEDPTMLPLPLMVQENVLVPPLGAIVAV